MSDTRASTPAFALLRRARAQQESAVRWLNLLSPVLVIAVPIAAWSVSPHPGWTGRHLGLTIALAGFVVGVLGRNATVGRRDGTVHKVFVAVLVAAAVTMMSVQSGGPGPECALLALLCLAVVLRGRLGIAVVLVGFAAVFVVAALTEHGFGPLVVLAGFAALYGVLFLAYRLAQSNRAAEILLAELEASQAERAAAAGLAERQHLAREMHDVLAHSLSGLLLQLEGARMLSTDPATDPRLRDAVGRAHHLGRSGLDEARRAIGMLRDDALPGPERLSGLAAEFEQDHGVPCVVSTQGEPRELSSQARLAIYRVAQEALTNIVKHACAPTRVEIRLAYGESCAELAVTDHARDSPAVTSTVDASGGYGLTGMRERAELLGGTLHAQPTADGFHVELHVPVGG